MFKLCAGLSTSTQLLFETISLKQSVDCSNKASLCQRTLLCLHALAMRSIARACKQSRVRNALSLKAQLNNPLLAPLLAPLRGARASKALLCYALRTAFLRRQSFVDKALLCCPLRKAIFYKSQRLPHTRTQRSCVRTKQSFVSAHSFAHTAKLNKALLCSCNKAQLCQRSCVRFFTLAKLELMICFLYRKQIKQPFFQN